MTPQLEAAYRAVSALPEAERVALLRFLCPDDPEADAIWDRMFAETADALDEIASRAWADHLAGRNGSGRA